ncbi:MAG: twin-arginine translocation signal domain-containing protein, partial [Planctomycetes bacterium]|nr:twin-arginine translocation signal domain-containing protein [Planctomycetota bacterium]
MSQTQERTKSRRGFLGDAAVVAGASALAAAGIPAVHAAGSDLIQVALIGCGGRGT